MDKFNNSKELYFKIIGLIRELCIIRENPILWNNILNKPQFVLKTLKCQSKLVFKLYPRWKLNVKLNTDFPQRFKVRQLESSDIFEFYRP